MRREMRLEVDSLLLRERSVAERGVWGREGLRRGEEEGRVGRWWGRRRRGMGLMVGGEGSGSGSEASASSLERGLVGLWRGREEGGDVPGGGGGGGLGFGGVGFEEAFYALEPRVAVGVFVFEDFFGGEDDGVVVELEDLEFVHGADVGWEDVDAVFGHGEDLGGVSWPRREERRGGGPSM